MDGAAVKEMADRFAEPSELKGMIVTPPGWAVGDPVWYIKPGPQASTLAVYTLGALRDYIKANRDTLDVGTLTVHVVSPQIVRLAGPLQERARNRETFVEAKSLDLTDGFLDKFMTLDQFAIGLQTRFAPSDQRVQLLGLFSNVRSESVKTSSDDGVGQTIVSKAGTVLVSEVPVPNPVTLQPFRTFREVRQPSSPFVLRVQSGPQGGLPTVGLFEADGGAWRIEAVEALRGWMAHELGDSVSILA